MTRYHDDRPRRNPDAIPAVLREDIVLRPRRVRVDPWTFSRSCEENRLEVKAGTRVDLRAKDSLYWIVRLAGWEDWNFDGDALHPRNVRLLTPLELLAREAE